MDFRLGGTMCKARPGMRCSNHAKVEIRNSQKALKEVLSKKDASESERKAAAQNLRNARIDFYTTREGQKNLNKILSDDSDVDKQETAMFYLQKAEERTERRKYATALIDGRKKVRAEHFADSLSKLRGRTLTDL